MKAAQASVFWIQASNPRVLGPNDPNDETLSDAIQTVFPLDAEEAFLNWSTIRIPLSYKYDLSVIAADVLQLVESLRTQPKGELIIEWPSDTFGATWVVKWEDPACVVTADWRSLHGGLEVLANRHPTISVPMSVMVAEWGGVMSVIHRALVSVGYASSQLAEMTLLERIVAEHPMGRLYRP